MLKALFPAFAWLVAITVLSATPAPSLPEFKLVSADKFEHAAAYGLLAWLILYGWKKSGAGGVTGLGSSALVFTFAAGYGVLMEFMQLTFFPNRHFEYDDMLANAAGALLGVLLFRILNQRHG